MSAQPEKYAEDIVVMVRTLNARPARVFAAWSDPKLLAQWWGPPGSVVK